MKRPRNPAILLLLGSALAASLSLGALTSKPAPNFPDDGASLDTSGWSFRKTVQITHPGPQQIELDLDVLSHAQLDFADLRLVRDGEQVPYIIERTSIQRALIPIVKVTNSTAPPTFTRWSFALPRTNLPVTRLSCTARTPLFQREMNLYELVFDERGTSYRYSRTRDTWTQTPNRRSKEFSLSFSPPEQTGSFELETQNGDNPPIELENFQFFYPATRVLFNAKAGDQLFLYYGFARALPPRYDLSLIANELLAANKSTAMLGAEETLKESTWPAPGTAGKGGKGGVIFWGILALVVVALLVVIARLLPKAESHPPK
jgi:hypothetical protein